MPEICAEIPYKEGCAVRVMTGSYVPEGYDAVIRQEDTDYGEKQVQIYREITAGTNYCCVGEDIREGEQILARGTRSACTPYGAFSGSLGIYKVPVCERIKCSILSTGSELMAFMGTPLLPGKMYNSISICCGLPWKDREYRCLSRESAEMIKKNY